MRWFRINRRWGGRLALFALALQLALSFAHIHAEDFAQLGAITAQTSTENGPPAGHDDNDGADHYCAICAVIHLSGTLALPSPPALAMPADVAPVRPSVAGRHDLVGARGDIFHARDPPPHS